MIDLASLAKIAGAGGTSVLASLGATYMLFTPLTEHYRMVAENQRGFIMDVVEKARNEPDGEFKESLCRTLHQAIAELCSVASDDAICQDREMWIERAGC